MAARRDDGGRKSNGRKGGGTRRASGGEGETRPEMGGVRVEHLINSVAQIQVWLSAVQAALEALGPNRPIQLEGELARRWSLEFVGIGEGKDCPPPDDDGDGDE
jgi:hypothetical protein